LRRDTAARKRKLTSGYMIRIAYALPLNRR
jgi:hypothetical protein